MRIPIKATTTAVLVILTVCAGGRESPRIPWDLAALSVPPKATPAPAHNVGEVKAVFLDGLPWKGQPTRIFAYYGVPKTESGMKVPAIVLVHGGGGSAFQSWVKQWVDRGYAAIAMDTSGNISGGGYNNHTRHEHAGPGGWGGFRSANEAVEDQWTYHAVGAVILSHSFLGSLPEVDADRVGLTGISWGGFLTCIAGSVDQRFKCAVPVYGCGFLGDNSVWLGDFRSMGKDMTAKWLGLWDPSVFLPRMTAPVLWISGTNDFAYPLDSLRKSYRLPGAPRHLAIRPRMPHGQGDGQAPPEILAFADSILRGGPPIPRVSESGRVGMTAWASYDATTDVRNAELLTTCDSGKWQDRKWSALPATIDGSARKVSAQLPEGTTVYYFNLTDDRGLTASSEHEELPASGTPSVNPRPSR